MPINNVIIERPWHVDRVQVTFKLTSKDLEYVGVDLRPVLEAGEFLFGVGPAADCRADPDSCAALTVTVSDSYHPACQVNEPCTYSLSSFIV